MIVLSFKVVVVIYSAARKSEGSSGSKAWPEIQGSTFSRHLLDEKLEVFYHLAKGYTFGVR